MSRLTGVFRHNFLFGSFDALSCLVLLIQCLVFGFAENNFLVNIFCLVLVFILFQSIVTNLDALCQPVLFIIVDPWVRSRLLRRRTCSTLCVVRRCPSCYHVPSHVTCLSSRPVPDRAGAPSAAGGRRQRLRLVPGGRSGRAGPGGLQSRGRARRRRCRGHRRRPVRSCLDR